MSNTSSKQSDNRINENRGWKYFYICGDNNKPQLEFVIILGGSAPWSTKAHQPPDGVLCTSHERKLLSSEVLKKKILNTNFYPLFLERNQFR